MSKYNQPGLTDEQAEKILEELGAEWSEKEGCATLVIDRRRYPRVKFPEGSAPIKWERTVPAPKSN